MMFGVILLIIAVALFALLWFTSSNDRVRLLVAIVLGHRTTQYYSLDELDISYRVSALQGWLLVIIPFPALIGILSLGLGLALL